MPHRAADVKFDPARGIGTKIGTGTGTGIEIEIEAETEMDIRAMIATEKDGPTRAAVHCPHALQESRRLHPRPQQTKVVAQRAPGLELFRLWEFPSLTNHYSRVRGVLLSRPIRAEASASVPARLLRPPVLPHPEGPDKAPEPGHQDAIPVTTALALSQRPPLPYQPRPQFRGRLPWTERYQAYRQLLLG